VSIFSCYRAIGSFHNYVLELAVEADVKLLGVILFNHKHTYLLLAGALLLLAMVGSIALTVVPTANHIVWNWLNNWIDFSAPDPVFVHDEAVDDTLYNIIYPCVWIFWLHNYTSILRDTSYAIIYNLLSRGSDNIQASNSLLTESLGTSTCSSIFLLSKDCLRLEEDFFVAEKGHIIEGDDEIVN